MTRAPRHLLASLLGCALLAGCAHTPSDDDTRRRAPEPKTAGEQPPTLSAIPARDDAAAPGEAPAQAPEASDAPDEARDADSRPKKRALQIDLSEQMFSYTEDGSLVKSGPISSGTDGHTTPTGKFSVLSKDEDKVSSRYTNQLGMQAWMPYAIQFNGHYFIHEGWLPGYPDSHGCVRVGEKDARFLFETLEIGDPVTVRK